MRILYTNTCPYRELNPGPQASLARFFKDLIIRSSKVVMRWAQFTIGPSEFIFMRVDYELKTLHTIELLRENLFVIFWCIDLVLNFKCNSNTNSKRLRSESSVLIWLYWRGQTTRLPRLISYKPLMRFRIR